MRRDRRAGRTIGRSREVVRHSPRSGAGRRGYCGLLPREFHGLQASEDDRIPRRIAEIERRQDPATRTALTSLLKDFACTVPAIASPASDSAAMPGPESGESGDIACAWL